MGVAVNSGLDVHVGHPEVYPVQVQGPKAKDTMRDLFGDWVLDMKYYWCDEADLDGIPVVISRTGWTAVVGYEIYLRDSSRGDDLWERILDAGKPYNIRVTPSSDIRRHQACFRIGALRPEQIANAVAGADISHAGADRLHYADGIGSESIR